MFPLPPATPPHFRFLPGAWLAGGLALLPLALSAQPTIAPSFLTPPARRAFLKIGETLELTVTVAGFPAPALQWYRQGQPLPGATGPVFRLENVQLEDAGKYYATATNASGVATSDHTRVSVRSYFAEKSVARQWMEELLDAIRQDYPAPTVHSRNLFTLSAAMWDAWCAYEPPGGAVPFLADPSPPPLPSTAEARAAARREAISIAAYRVLATRFRLSPGAAQSLPAFRRRLRSLGYDPDRLSLEGDSASAVGHRIAARLLAYGWTDGANEKASYLDQTGYLPANEPLVFKFPGAETADPNRWQPLAFDFLILQNGIPLGSTTQIFLGANWGGVTPFALTRTHPDTPYLDPGPPPTLGSATDQAYKDAAVQLIEYGSWLDPADGLRLDVSPRSRHNNPLGTNDGHGYRLNPVTGLPYAPNEVLRADYGRVLAEFWADGPDSETPPGHWNSVAHAVSDDPRLLKRLAGVGPVLDDLEWDVKLYFALNAAVSDAAIACWDAKRRYDFVRPITMIRYMGGRGQSTRPEGPSYHPHGLPLQPGLIEIITAESSAPGQRHAHLAAHLGEIALYTWTGVPVNPATDLGGVGWIRAVEWMPYQRDTFVTPPFAAYTSGHSTFSRAAAEVLAAFTGSPFFPGGFSSFTAPAHDFLEFERGPEETVTLTWATYFDAADEAGLSRLYGGIHVWPDDLRGRIMGAGVGRLAYARALTHFAGSATPLPWDPILDRWAADLAGSPGELSAPAAYREDPASHLARFFFGYDPNSPTGRLPAPEVRLAPGNPYARLRFVVPSSLVSRQFILEFSEDLLTWTSIFPGEYEMTSQPLDPGRRQILLDDPQPLPAQLPRFYRLRPVPLD